MHSCGEGAPVRVVRAIKGYESLQGLDSVFLSELCHSLLLVHRLLVSFLFGTVLSSLLLPHLV